MAYNNGVLKANRMTDSEIVEKIRTKVEENGETITPKQGLFAIKLFDYAINYGKVYDDNKRCVVGLTIKEMCDYFGYKKSAVIEVIAKLDKVGIIKRKCIASVVKDMSKLDRKSKVTIIECDMFCNISSEREE